MLVFSRLSRKLLITRNSFLQFLKNSTHVLTVTAAHLLIYDHTLLKGLENIYLNCRQTFPRFKNTAMFNSLVTLIESSSGLLFKIQRNFANPRELQVNWTLLQSLFLFMVEKRYFPRHGNVNNAFWVYIIP